MCYTPPAGRYGGSDSEHAAYLAGHSAGWGHANYVDGYGSAETVEQAAQPFAAGRYPAGSAEHARALEGFTDGAAAYHEPCADCGETD